MTNISFLKDIHQRNCFDTISETKEAKMFMDFLKYVMSNILMQELQRMFLKEEIQDCFDSNFFKKLLVMFEDDPILIKSFLDYIFTEPINFPNNFSYKSLKQPIVTSRNDVILNEEQIKEIFKKNPNYKDTHLMFLRGSAHLSQQMKFFLILRCLKF